VGIALEDATELSGKQTVMVFLETGYIPEGIFVQNEASNLLGVTSQDNSLPPAGELMSSILNAVEHYLENAILRVKKIIAGELETTKLKTHTGITTYDEQTGEPYCISVSGGQLKTTLGECGSQNEPAPSTGESSSNVPDQALESPIEQDKNEVATSPAPEQELAPSEPTEAPSTESSTPSADQPSPEIENSPE
ncbi:hypothetical protein KW791_03150, partial [Candidatus Parcubacteria bacterium]|nr:hypothetical protein [Candidatus Parcubacteria bacterium]